MYSRNRLVLHGEGEKRRYIFVFIQSGFICRILHERYLCGVGSSDREGLRSASPFQFLVRRKVRRRNGMDVSRTRAGYEEKNAHDISTKETGGVRGSFRYTYQAASFATDFGPSVLLTLHAFFGLHGLASRFVESTMLKVSE